MPTITAVTSPQPTRRRARDRLVALVTLALVAGAACSGDTRGTDEASTACTTIDLVVDPDSLDVHRRLANGFNTSDDHELDDGGCARVRVRAMTPDRVADRLLDGWSVADDGPAPALWSPGWSAWVDRVDTARADDGQEPVTGDRIEVMASPLVLALPEAVAEAMGHPERAIGWADLVRLAVDPQGWAAYGHPEWGQLRLGKTDPRVASDGLAALVGQAHAAHAGGGQVAPDVLTDPTVEHHITMLERSVAHYGESSDPFLERWERAEEVDAIAGLAIPVVEERRVVVHDPVAVEDLDDEGRSVVDLTAVAPVEGTVVLDHPVVEITNTWVTERQTAARDAFLAHLETAAARKVVGDAGFRRPDLTFAPGSPAAPATGVDRDRPLATITKPEPAAVAALSRLWPEVRRGSRVTIVLDASASMGQPTGPGGPTRLTVLRDALGPAMDDLDDSTEVTVWAFARGIDDGEDGYLELIEPAPLAEVREDIDAAIAAMTPGRGTPLYRTITRAVDAATDDYDPNRINSVVVVTDGINADGDASDDAEQLDELVTALVDQSSGPSADPVRIFPIAFGDTADLPTLRRLARASKGTELDARDPDDLATVLATVVRTV